MASISNVTLLVTDGSSADSRKVTVKGTMSFTSGEVGQSFRLEIRLFGEDKSGDTLGHQDPVGDDQLYTFLWPGSFLSTPYKRFTVASAGSQTLAESRTIQAEKLDEDSGLEYMGDADINTPYYMTRKDEVYARVTLSTVPVTARSATITLGSGV